MCQRALKSNNGDKKRINEKKKKKDIFSLFWLVSGSEGRKEILERERVQLLSRFPSVRTVGSRRSNRISWSTLQRLSVDTDFLEFRQLREVRVFSYLSYSLDKSHFYG